eukprot:TRINITY_DN81339_c0_g1_i1.p1 TRINITY_DN81339_c0_g1~~TRINITY_DN81339_c0_g1_i1.p1  ORF type:complete len:533 (+),score=42.72 TRINITY_DN81339_c0_g1_i1:146-1600(+)
MVTESRHTRSVVDENAFITPAERNATSDGHHTSKDNTSSYTASSKCHLWAYGVVGAWLLVACALFQLAASPGMASPEDTDSSEALALKPESGGLAHTVAQMPVRFLERLAAQASATPLCFAFLASFLVWWELVYMSLYARNKLNPEADRIHTQETTWFVVIHASDCFKRLATLVGLLMFGQRAQSFLEGTRPMRSITATCLICWSILLMVSFSSSEVPMQIRQKLEGGWRILRHILDPPIDDALFAGIETRIFPRMIPIGLLGSLRLLGGMLDLTLTALWTHIFSFCYASIIDGLLDINVALTFEFPGSSSWKTSVVKPLVDIESRLRYLSTRINVIWVARMPLAIAFFVREYNKYRRTRNDGEFASHAYVYISDPLLRLAVCSAVPLFYKGIFQKLNDLRATSSLEAEESSDPGARYEAKDKDHDLEKLISYLESTNRGTGPAACIFTVCVTPAMWIGLLVSFKACIGVLIRDEMYLFRGWIT